LFRHAAPSGVMATVQCRAPEGDVITPQVFRAVSNGLATACHRAQNQQAWRSLVKTAASTGQATR